MFAFAKFEGKKSPYDYQKIPFYLSLFFLIIICIVIYKRLLITVCRESLSCFVQKCYLKLESGRYSYKSKYKYILLVY